MDCAHPFFNFFSFLIGVSGGRIGGAGGNIDIKYIIY